ncbi:hydrogenase nickel incorporation protein HypB [Sporolactobacillus sp. THM19-2]|jgi:hydrogenase nickel incorporation protein HypB|uniref:hydrogenase nickel incorporation protein HypB n=1 Tax=Sporolactobacillus sp. THM19-2 TaxID=2511171 RepID=UPI00102275B6|nr:hydrogenase nickel incorporation protein HypB [Sporolactobacillus sp. THM19-2]RYL93611.1 hydrogenase accessory protein HypB [Sporolactobacillus sp. THM19-2]
MKITLDKNVMDSNDHAASYNRDLFRRTGTLVINMMSSPGAGKTAILEKTVSALAGEFRIAVIEGDIATERDAERIRRNGVKAVQIATEGECHLDPRMVAKVLPEIDLDTTDILFIENVGNLVCPSEFDLGQNYRIVVLSTPEGNDKMTKYPLMFHVTDLALINKIDLLPYLSFDLDQAKKDLRGINPHSRLMPLSARSGEGFDVWLNWIRKAYQDGVKD